MSRGKQHGKKEWLRFFSELKKKKASQFIFKDPNEPKQNKKKEIYIQIFCSEIENLKDKQDYKKYQRNYKVEKKF